ncbi:hypothetical protein GTP45_07555 [Pseudoduganella sp. FT55W]|uniref:Uncharacterized protein n=1 Tax=Duganella rivi TaxID=2666083 RepID=A0A7X4KB74_9BURK|nr:hypothetical protein [Duganella rivi]MYM66682.1 hypothetical protein [Duganella rivi]
MPKQAIDDSAVAAVLQQIWRLRLTLRQQQQLSGQIQARQQARRSEQVCTALQRYLYRVDSQR